MHKVDHRAADATTAPRSLYLSWIRFQRRPLAMQPSFGYRTHFLPIRWRGTPGLALSYLVNFCRSLKLLWSERPGSAAAESGELVSPAHAG